MKQTLLVLFAAFCMLIISCKKDDIKLTSDAIVVKDCTGTYIHIETSDIDYGVINNDKLNSYNSGTQVKVIYTIKKTISQLSFL